MKSQRKAPTPEWEGAEHVGEAEGFGEIRKEAPTPEREEIGGAKRPNSPEGYKRTKRIVQRFGGQLKLMRVEIHKEV